jgi:hypothetical protein
LHVSKFRLRETAGGGETPGGRFLEKTDNAKVTNQTARSFMLSFLTIITMTGGTRNWPASIFAGAFTIDTWIGFSRGTSLP